MLCRRTAEAKKNTRRQKKHIFTAQSYILLLIILNNKIRCLKINTMFYIMWHLLCLSWLIMWNKLFNKRLSLTTDLLNHTFTSSQPFWEYCTHRSERRLERSKMEEAAAHTCQRWQLWWQEWVGWCHCIENWALSISYTSYCPWMPHTRSPAHLLLMRSSSH